MATALVTFEVAREIGLALPDVEESTIHGAPPLKMHDKLLACVPVNKIDSEILSINITYAAACFRLNRLIPTPTELAIIEAIPA